MAEGGPPGRPGGFYGGDTTIRPILSNFFHIAQAAVPILNAMLHQKLDYVNRKTIIIVKTEQKREIRKAELFTEQTRGGRKQILDHRILLIYADLFGGVGGFVFHTNYFGKIGIDSLRIRISGDAIVVRREREPKLFAIPGK